MVAVTLTQKFLVMISRNARRQTRKAFKNNADVGNPSDYTGFASGGSTGSNGFQDSYTNAYNEMQKETGSNNFLQAFTGPNGQLFYNYVGANPQNITIMPATPNTPSTAPPSTSTNSPTVSAPSAPTISASPNGVSEGGGGGSSNSGAPSSASTGSIGVDAGNVGHNVGQAVGVGLSLAGVPSFGVPTTIGDLVDASQNTVDGAPSISVGQAFSGLAHNATFGLSDLLGTQSIATSQTQNNNSTAPAQGIGIPTGNTDLGMNTPSSSSSASSPDGEPAGVGGAISGGDHGMGVGGGDASGGDNSGSSGGGPGGDGSHYSKGGIMSKHTGFLAHPAVQDALKNGPLGQAGYSQGGMLPRGNEMMGDSAGAGYADGGFISNNPAATPPQGMANGGTVSDGGPGYQAGGLGADAYAPDNSATTSNEPDVSQNGTQSNPGNPGAPNGFLQGEAADAYNQNYDTFPQDQNQDQSSSAPTTGFATGGFARRVADDAATVGMADDEKLDYNFARSHWHGEDKASRGEAADASRNSEYKTTPHSQEGNIRKDGGFAKGGMNYDTGGPVINPDAQAQPPSVTPGDPSSPDNSKVSAVTQPDGATKDDQPAMLSKGEFVLDAATVAFFGVDKIKKMQLIAHKSLMEQAQAEQAKQQDQGPQQGGLGSPPQGAPPPQQAQGGPTQPMPLMPPPSTAPNATESRIAATDTPKGPPMSQSMMGI